MLDSDNEEEEEPEKRSSSEKGKRKLREVFHVDSGEVSLFGENSDGMKASRHRHDDVADTAGLDLLNSAGEASRNKELEEKIEFHKRYKKQREEAARRSAPHYARYVPRNKDGAPPQVDAEADAEDLLARFNAAMRIMNGGAEMNWREKSAYNKLEPVNWAPRPQDRARPESKYWIPSLKDLCLFDIVENVDALPFLQGFPEALIHQLSDWLCDSRRMNSHFMELFIKESPTEIRLRDSSWLTEGEVQQYFQQCDMTKLTVLQLDQCAHCLSDYSLHTTLARSANCLPDLVSLSLTGAWRISDFGFRAILASVPALRSLNLSQCYILTSACIENLANSLGSVLRELYLNDCQRMDAMVILPALMKFEHLEILSLAGIETVCDDFMEAFITARGHNLKKLNLTDGKKLTDSSVKVIAKKCSALSALDLSNLNKLTDYSLGYLTYGCRAIQTLKFCRNSFSDEAIAAFLEFSGKCLKVLSLNNIKTVGNNTAIALATHSRSLNYLDLSWCRNLHDEALGLIVDSCLSLKILKLFGCTQITELFLSGHSNPDVKLIDVNGVGMNPLWKYVGMPDP